MFQGGSLSLSSSVRGQRTSLHPPETTPCGMTFDLYCFEACRQRLVISFRFACLMAGLSKVSANRSEVRVQRSKT